MKNVKCKKSIIKLFLCFALICSFLTPHFVYSQGGKSKEELAEYYKKLYEKMKQKKKTSPAIQSEKDRGNKLKKQKKKQKRMEMVRKRQEKRKKMKELWLKKFREESGKIKIIDKAPDLKKVSNLPEGMTYIAAGKFMRGQDWGEWPEVQPSQIIYLDAFFMDTYEVSVGKYKAYLKKLKKPIPSFLKDDDLSGDSQPVYKVNWKSANEYCVYVGKRLPTEAEWEKAARGWDTRYYPWGNELPYENGEYRANYSPGTARGMDGYLYTASVDSFKNGVSPYGIYNMIGNIGEWTADWYDPEYYQLKERKNPKGPETGKEKVVRGGGYDVGYQNLLLTVRIAAKPRVSNNFIGFRCAKNAN